MWEEFFNAAFAYQMTSTDSVQDSRVTAPAAKCNIMGYWHSSNTNTFLTATQKNRDTLICSDKCTGANVAICGDDSALHPRFDKATRHPLVDFAISDANTAADFKAFPDLQNYPASAGALVAVYSLPELRAVGGTLTLSRSSVGKSLINFFCFS